MNATALLMFQLTAPIAIGLSIACYLPRDAQPARAAEVSA